ncbi:MAG: hypothetical protein ACK2U9_02700, partial [Anaerolineae bacterium]
MPNRRLWPTLLAVLVIAALVLTACPSREEPAPEEVPVATEAPAQPQPEAAATEAPAEAAPTNTPATMDVTAPTDEWADVDPTGQTVTFWHQHTLEREEALKEIVDEFNSSNPYGITVVPEYQGSYGDIFNKMLTFMNTDDAPGLVVAYQN